jgi:hypothetical protein
MNVEYVGEGVYALSVFDDGGRAGALRGRRLHERGRLRRQLRRQVGQ